jgi:hypothetical protein
MSHDELMAVFRCFPALDERSRDVYEIDHDGLEDRSSSVPNATVEVG